MASGTSAPRRLANGAWVVGPNSAVTNGDIHVNPTSTDIRLINARAVARNLRDAAQLCMCDQSAVRARLIQAAQTIDEIALMAEASTFVAKLNHDTIMEISR
jgi:hypothetical protein